MKNKIKNLKEIFYFINEASTLSNAILSKTFVKISPSFLDYQLAKMAFEYLTLKLSCLFQNKQLVSFKNFTSINKDFNDCYKRFLCQNSNTIKQLKEIRNKSVAHYEKEIVLADFIKSHLFSFVDDLKDFTLELIVCFKIPEEVNEEI